jgi:hypothetical protein
LTGATLVAGKIFISYRRGDDPGTTGRLFDALKAAFDEDRLFLDVDNIEPGLDFIEVIKDRVSKSDVLLAVIGQHWIEARDKNGRRRLEDPKDSVRIEIESAINQKKRVIPVLIGETKIPDPDILPDSLQVLSGRNAVPIRHERFRDDMANLTKSLRHILGDDGQTQASPTGLFQPVSPLPEGKSSSRPQDLLGGRTALLACALVAVLAIAGGTYYFAEAPSPAETKLASAPAPSPLAQQPRWCQDADLNPAELRVCATPGLLALDKQNGDIYGGLMAKASPEQRRALSADENKWLSDTRNKCAQDENCLYNVYRERIAYFTNPAK